MAVEVNVEYPDTEKRVRRMLEQLKGEGVVLGFKHAEPNGDLDRAKIDFLIYISHGLSVTLQVKGGPGRCCKHRKSHAHIWCLEVLSDESDKELKERIRLKIERIRPT